ncbi:MAG: DUF1330 domain-containing protein [Alphaproteobacteria bacterium]
MPAYFIVDQLEVTDPDTMKEYSAGVGATVKQYEGTPLVRGGDFEVLEGDYQPHRMVVMSFADMAALKAWYDSPEYAPLKEMRKSSSRSNIVAVEGL